MAVVIKNHDTRTHTITLASDNEYLTEQYIVQPNDANDELPAGDIMWSVMKSSGTRTRTKVTIPDLDGNNFMTAQAALSLAQQRLLERENAIVEEVRLERLKAETLNEAITNLGLTDDTTTEVTFVE